MVIVNPEQELKVINSGLFSAVIQIIAKTGIIIITDFTTDNYGYLKSRVTGEIRVYIPKTDYDLLLMNWSDLLNRISYDLSLGFEVNKGGKLEWLT